MRSAPIDQVELRRALGSEDVSQLVGSYFRGLLRRQIGFTEDALVVENRESTRCFLKSLYAWVTVIGSRIAYNIASLGVSEFGRKIESVYDLRRLEDWLAHGFDITERRLNRARKTLSEHLGDALDITFSNAQKATLGLAYCKGLKGMGLKSAALFMKLLCQDTQFFQGFTDAEALFVPADRVIARIVSYLLPPKDPEELESADYVTADRSILGFIPGKDAGFWYLQSLAARVMGSWNAAWSFENLWFIGHFYHDNMRRPGRGWPAYSAYDPPVEPCRLREALVLAERATFHEHYPPTWCPLREFGCEYDYALNEHALYEVSGRTY